MPIDVKQSTAQSIGLWFADSSDGKTGKTGLTVAVTLQKFGETSFSSITPTSVTEIGSGHYVAILNTTHMNTVGLTSLRATGTGADPCDMPNCIEVVGFDKTALTWLTPTTAGRTLDVSAGGEAGVDWANVGSPTTTVGLSGTTVKTATDVETDTQDLQARTPAALVGGRTDASVGAMANDVMTAAAAAADLTTELQTGLATAASLATVAGFIDTEITTALADLDDIQTRLPAALVSGRMDSSTGAMAANVVTAAAIADAAIDAATFAASAITATVIASDAITAAKIADGAIDRATFAQDAKDMFGELRRNQAQSGAAGTITLDSSASAVNDFYKNALILIASGTGSGQFGQVSSYVGSTKVATMAANWATTPDATSVFVVFTGSAGTTAAVVRDAILDFAYRTGRTVRGLLRRLGAAVEGKATGLIGTTATFFQPDGSTTEFSATQSVAGGTRATATVTNSEVP